jgi:GNAT superfamily N-acetyltransferase
MMQTGYAVRPARQEDIPLLPSIEQAAGVLFKQVGWEDENITDTYPVEALHAAHQGGRLWVAVDAGDQPVGFAVASVVDGRGHLDEVDVHPDHGRRGIGRALVEQVCAWASQRGYPAVTLTTERDVPWNAPFYARLGFTILEPDDWTDGLRQIVAHEAERGLAIETRVVMIRRV